MRVTEAAEADRAARATERVAAAAQEDELRAELHGLREEAAAAAREPRELARAEHLETVVETLRSADSRVGRTEQELRHELAERQVAEASGQAALAAAAARLEERGLSRASPTCRGTVSEVPPIRNGLCLHEACGRSAAAEAAAAERAAELRELGQRWGAASGELVAERAGAATLRA